MLEQGRSRAAATWKEARSSFSSSRRPRRVSFPRSQRPIGGSAAARRRAAADDRSTPGGKIAESPRKTWLVLRHSRPSAHGPRGAWRKARLRQGHEALAGDAGAPTDISSLVRLPRWARRGRRAATPPEKRAADDPWVIRIKGSGDSRGGGFRRFGLDNYQWSIHTAI